jgi:hypothetical protein
MAFLQKKDSLRFLQANLRDYVRTNATDADPIKIPVLASLNRRAARYSNNAALPVKGT